MTRYTDSAPPTVFHGRSFGVTRRAKRTVPVRKCAVPPCRVPKREV